MSGDADSLTRRLILAAAICGASGVLLGAFGAHGLESYLTQRSDETVLVDRRLGQFNTGVRYQLVHSVALLALAGLAVGSARTRRWIGRLLITGVVLFSGSLYALVATNNTSFGMVAPLGGLAWIIGWSLMAALPRGSSAAR